MKKIILFLFIFVCFSGSKAQAVSLYVRSNKSYVQPGSSYDLTVFSSLVPFTGYTGLLDVDVTSCNQSGSCNNATVPWGSYQVVNGSIKVDIAANFTPSYFRARYKPRNSNWEWSNEIQINVGMTQGLENAQDYWLLSLAPAKFISTNFVDKKDSETLIGFKSPTSLCGETVQSMYFMKSDPSGYWDPHNPWYDTIRAHGYDSLNLMWHIAPWQKKTGWEDEYLTAVGHEIYKSNFSDPFNMTTNFQEKTGQYRNKFPNYILSAKWIGAGWGAGGRVESYQADPRDSFCGISTAGGGRPGTWAVHADIVKLSLPKYEGLALRYRFYEGGENFVTDATKWGLREDWYFVKNVGLVKIEAKYFGPSAGVISCQQDTDCLINETMASPHIRLVRSDLLIPIPTFTPIPTPISNGTVSGYVYINDCGNTNCNTCRRPGGQTVTISGGSTSVICSTDSSGYYSCSVPPGTYTVSISTKTGETCSWGSKDTPNYCQGTGCSQTTMVTSGRTSATNFTVFPVPVIFTPTPIPPTATPIRISGDYDGNGIVSLGDFGEWKKRYLAGSATLADFAVWKKAYLNN